MSWFLCGTYGGSIQFVRMKREQPILDRYTILKIKQDTKLSIIKIMVFHSKSLCQGNPYTFCHICLQCSYLYYINWLFQSKNWLIEWPMVSDTCYLKCNNAVSHVYFEYDKKQHSEYPGDIPGIWLNFNLIPLHLLFPFPTILFE